MKIQDFLLAALFLTITLLVAPVVAKVIVSVFPHPAPQTEQANK